MTNTESVINLGLIVLVWVSGWLWGGGDWRLSLATLFGLLLIAAITVMAQTRRP